MIDEIRLWWRFEGRYIRKNFVKGIKNLREWFPVVWKDRDWDSDFIYEVLIHKLEKQATYIYKCGNHVSSKRDAEKMFLCARLARMQQEELYGTEYMDYYDLKWEFIPTDETKQWFTVETEVTDEDFIDYFAKYQRQYRLLDKTGLDKKQIAQEIAYRNQERSRKLLFKIMEENIESWWN